MDFIKVEKNGIQDNMNKTVWDAIGGDSNKDGWRRVVETPVEVVQIKKKSSEPAPAAEVIPQAPEGEVKEDEKEEVKAPKAKAKPAKKK